MALPTQLLAIPFRAGLDEKTADQVLEPGQGFVTIENRVQSKSGGFDKRPGFSQQTKARQDGSTRTKGVSIFSLGNQTCVYDGSRLDVSSDSAGWVEAGKLRNISIERVPPLTTSSMTFQDAGYYVDGYEMARIGNYLFLTHTVGVGSDYVLVISVFDSVTGTNVLEKEFASNTVPRRCKFGAIGSKAIAFYSDNVAPTNIYAIELDTGTLGLPGAAWSAPFTAASTWDGTDMDVSSLDDLGSINPAVVLGYSDSGNLKLARMTAYNTITASTSHIIGGTIGAIALGGDSSNKVYAAVTSAASLANVELYTFDPTTVAQVVPSGVAASSLGATPPYRLGVTAIGTNQAAVVAHQRSTSTVPYNILFWSQMNVTGGGPVPFLQSSAAHVMSITRPLSYAGKMMVHLGYLDYQDAGNTQRMEYIADISTANILPLGTVNARLSSWSNPGSIISTNGNSCTHMATIGDNVYFATYQLLNAAARSVGIIKLSYDQKVSPVAITSNDGAHLSGALPSVFDGRIVIEDGFLYAPGISGALDGAGSIPPGSYSYVAIFERIDSFGNVWWSAPSTPATVVIPDPGINQDIIVTVQGYKLSLANDNSFQPTQVVLYRTKKDGTVYYELETKANQDTNVFTDSALDTDIETRAVLYTQPGQLGASQSRLCPPSFTCETVHMDRVFGANGKNVWYSAVTVDGEGTWFSDAFQFPVERGGDITALSSQDGHLYIFKPDSIYYVDGQGPPENGGNGTEFSSPIEIPTTGGCIDPRSVVRTQAGIMFQSTRGIELLTRKQEVMWIGEGVDDHVASFPVCTSAVLDEATSRVMFTLAQYESPSALGGGCILVYDFTVSMWSVTTLDTSVALNVATSAIVPTSSGLVYALLAGNGTVLNENQNEGIDRTLSPVSQVLPVATIETPWIKMAGLGGYQRTRRVQVQGERLDPHDLIVSVAYDFSPTYTQTRRWTWAELVSFAAEDVEMHLKTQKCQALRIKIEDAPPTGGAVSTGKGCTLFGLTIEWGAKQGTNKLPARQRS